MELRISNLEDRNLQIIQAQEKRELKTLKSEKTIQKLIDFIRKDNIRLIIIEGKERKKEAENLFKEITAEHFPNLGKELYMQVRKANRTPIISMPKDL